MATNSTITTLPINRPTTVRRYIYPALVGLIYILWITYMEGADRWHLFQELWPVSATMALGSFVAGATPQGGATVAFPVFTKVLQFPASDARTFGLMIQAIGMTMASVLILVRRIKIMPHVIGWVSVGGAVGIVIGAFWGQIPLPFPKILFTFVATAFGVALVISRWVLNSKPQDDIPNWGQGHRLVFALVGIFGGIFAANTGAGTDLLTFIVLTLAFGINEKISTPTTVIIMGINSVVGFFVYGVLIQDIGVAWDYWLVAIPIVIIGAPLGAFVVSIVKRDWLISAIIFLILVELTTTLWLVPFSSTAIMVTGGALLVSILWFWGMLYYRQKQHQLQLTHQSE
ncbi:MAG: sulfite exporter TauE/SafE family protein [Chloroflexota bacterium]